MTQPDTIDQAGAAQIFTTVLGQPGGGRTVLGLLGEVPFLVHRPAQAGGLFRKKVEESLLAGEWAFVLTDPDGVRMLVQHVVRGVVLQSTVLGPGDAARQLAAAVFAGVGQSGPHGDASLQAALFGLAAVTGR